MESPVQTLRQLQLSMTASVGQARALAASFEQELQRLSTGLCELEAAEESLKALAGQYIQVWRDQ